MQTTAFRLFQVAATSLAATLVITCALVLSSHITAADADAAHRDWVTPPGWAATAGGEGGKIIEVTTLDSQGTGSLREALQAKGPRTVVFRVGGTINLAAHNLSINEPHLTIAGETAPSPGITLIRGGIGINTHDVIIRHLRLRVGESEKGKKSGWEADGISTTSGSKVIIDHCSVAWATDENISASGPRFRGKSPDEWRKGTSHQITISHCIIAEGLLNSTHTKGKHSMGSLIHDNTDKILVFGNLYISNNERNPLFKGGARGAVVNNLVHNPGNYLLRYVLVESEWEGHEWQTARIACVGNVLQQGPSTNPKSGFAYLKGPLEASFSDNQHLDKDGKELPFRIDFYHTPKKSGDKKIQPTPGTDQKIVDTPPLWPDGLIARPSAEVTQWVLENAGARPWERDSMDKRLIDETLSGGGKIIDSQEEVGGYEGLTVP